MNTKFLVEYMIASYFYSTDTYTLNMYFYVVYIYKKIKKRMGKNSI